MNLRIYSMSAFLWLTIALFTADSIVANLLHGHHQSAATGHLSNADKHLHSGCFFKDKHVSWRDEILKPTHYRVHLPFKTNHLVVTVSTSQKSQISLFAGRSSSQSHLVYDARTYAQDSVADLEHTLDVFLPGPATYYVTSVILGRTNLVAAQMCFAYAMITLPPCRDVYKTKYPSSFIGCKIQSRHYEHPDLSEIVQLIFRSSQRSQIFASRNLPATMNSFHATSSLSESAFQISLAGSDHVYLLILFRGQVGTQLRLDYDLRRLPYPKTPPSSFGAVGSLLTKTTVKTECVFGAASFATFSNASAKCQDFYVARPPPLQVSGDGVTATHVVATLTQRHALDKNLFKFNALHYKDDTYTDAVEVPSSIFEDEEKRTIQCVQFWVLHNKPAYWEIQLTNHLNQQAAMSKDTSLCFSYTYSHEGIPNCHHGPIHITPPFAGWTSLCKIEVDNSLLSRDAFENQLVIRSGSDIYVNRNRITFDLNDYDARVRHFKFGHKTLTLDLPSSSEKAVYYVRLVYNFVDTADFSWQIVEEGANKNQYDNAYNEDRYKVQNDDQE